MFIPTSPSNLDTFFGRAELSDTNSVRLNGTSAAFRDPSTTADANDFCGTDGNTFIDTVDTPSFSFGTNFVLEVSPGSSTEKILGAIWLGATGTRYGAGGIYGVIMMSSAPSAEDRTNIQTYLADLAGVSL